MRYLYILILLVSVVNHTDAQLVPNISSGPWMPKYDSLYTGKPYTTFQLITLGGKRINNASCQNKITVLDFWFESCRGCRTEIPQLNQLYDSLKNDTSVQFLAITFDNPDGLPNFLKEQNILYPIATTNDHEEFTRLCYHMGSPSKIIIDKKGDIAAIGLLGFDNDKLSVASYLSFIRGLK